MSKGCKILSLDKCIYVCEFKCSKNMIYNGIIKEVDAKCKALVVPKCYSLRAVLAHVNGVVEREEDARYFARIIDFSEFLR
jgi:hypothetical protein